METETAQILSALRRSIHSGPLLLHAPREIHTCRTLRMHDYIFRTIEKYRGKWEHDVGNRAAKAAEFYHDKIDDETYRQLNDGEWVPAEEAFPCERCGGVFNYETEEWHSVSQRRGEDTWCEICTDENAFRCDSSREYFSSNWYTQITVDGESVCQEENEDELYHWDSDGEYHWEPEPEEEEEESDGVERYHGSSREWKNRNYGSALLFGVELELKASNSREAVANIANDLGFIAEEDGSLDGTYGVEIIGNPLAFSDYRGTDSPWQNFLRRVRGKAVGWDAGTEYGLHVSINRRALTDYHTGKMLVFVNENKRLCEKVAGRKEVSWAVYKDKKLTSGKRESSEKYEALAIRSRDRLEFRIFRSTLSIEGFLRAVEFTASIVEFTRISSAIRLTESAFRGFLTLHAGEYRHLARHLGIPVPVREKPLILESEIAA